MSRIVKKSFNSAGKNAAFHLADVDIVDIERIELRRMNVHPGWHWEESMIPVLGHDNCPVDHLFFTITVRLELKMDDETTEIIGPGEIRFIPRGPYAWVVSDEPVVGIDFQGGDIHRKLLG